MQVPEVKSVSHSSLMSQLEENHCEISLPLPFTCPKGQCEQIIILLNAKKKDIHIEIFIILSVPEKIVAGCKQ